MLLAVVDIEGLVMNEVNLYLGHPDVLIQLSRNDNKNGLTHRCKYSLPLRTRFFQLRSAPNSEDDVL